MHEIWKDICGYENLYKVSNLGRVMSLNYNNTHSPHIMALTKSSTGYLHVQLYKNKKPRTFNVHRLVADAFIKAVSFAEEINHIDGNKENNSVSNLEWVTKSENQLHSLKLGLHSPSPNKNRFGKDNPSSKSILQYDKSGNFIRRWDSVSDAARFFNVRPSTISICLTGRRPSMCGYKWLYETE